MFPFRKRPNTSFLLASRHRKGRRDHRPRKPDGLTDFLCHFLRFGVVRRGASVENAPNAVRFLHRGEYYPWTTCLPQERGSVCWVGCETIPRIKPPGANSWIATVP